MILSTHALVGAAIGKNIPNPWFIIPISICVHYLLDGLRHGEYLDIRRDQFKDMYWKVLIDLSIGYGLVAAYAISFNLDTTAIFNVGLGTLISQLSDLLTLFHRYLPKNKLLGIFRDIHGWAHRYDRNPKYSPERQWTLRNTVNDMLVFVLALVILFL